jgi:signal transduction histidine kinase
MLSARPAISSAATAALAVPAQACRGLAHVLIGPDPSSVWQWLIPHQRRVAYRALGVATLALCAVDLAGVATIGQLLLAVPVVALLPLAARFPMLAWRIGWLALLLAPLVPAHWRGGWPWGAGQILALLGVFCIAGVRQRRPELWWMWALSLIPWWLWLTAKVSNLDGSAGATVVFTAVAIAVDSVSSRLNAQRALTVQTERAEDERARRAVLEERTRIARELHDVVAHNMSLIAVRAETAPYRLPDLPESARAEFISLSAVAREGLVEMRRLLGVLRQDRPADLAPQPELADLPTLVDAARQAGLSVELSVPVGLDHLPAGVGLCVYRIVQESLSNAGQHAPGAAVTVSVDHDSGAVVLRVANGPGGSAGTPENGHGLTGMRERVTLLGGSLSAGPSPDGGFVVSAVLPSATRHDRQRRCGGRRWDYAVPDRRRPGDGAGGLRRGPRCPAGPAGCRPSSRRLRRGTPGWPAAARCRFDGRADAGHRRIGGHQADPRRR